MSKLIEIAGEIAIDNANGSSILAKKVLERISAGDFSPDELHNALRIVLEAHPDMAILRRLFSIVEKVPFERIPMVSMEFLKSLTHAPSKIAEFFVNYLPMNSIVLTYSSSGTVIEALRLAWKSGKLASVIVSEARPDLEGRVMAQILTANNIPVTITTDAALCSLIDLVDMVIVGADAITPEHIVNKIGTLQLALTSNYANTPVYVLASTHKFTQVAIPRKSSPVNKIWEDAPQNVKITAPLFESIPLALFSGVICERGMMGAQEIEMIIE